jgi:hypothetical protein
MFQHEDTALVLSFSIMMLHTDLHNDNNIKKMTMPEFVRNNRGIDEGQDIQEAILKGIYGRILKEEFQCCIDHTMRTEDYESRIVSKLPVPLVTEERVFVAEADVSELAKTKSKSPVKRVVTLVVFNDLLLVLSRSRWERRYAYRHHYALQDMSLTAVGKSPVGPSFELRNTEAKCLFKFAVTDEGALAQQHQAGQGGSEQGSQVDTGGWRRNASCWFCLDVMGVDMIAYLQDELSACFSARVREHEKKRVV